MILCDENVRILFHLDGSISPEDVLDITDKVNLSPNAMAIVIPGASCGIVSFNYKQIEEDYKKRGYEVIDKRIPSTFGFVILDSDKVTIGTGVDRSLDVVLPIPKRKMQVQSSELNGDTLQEIIDFKEELLKSNDYIISEGLLARFAEDTPWEITVLRLRRKESRSSITMRLQPLHFILISAPVRITVHSSEPQGWGLRVFITSPIKIISLSIVHFSRGFPNTLGCRPFFTEKESLALFPGVQNPPGPLSVKI